MTIKLYSIFLIILSHFIVAGVMFVIYREKVALKLFNFFKHPKDKLFKFYLMITGTGAVMLLLMGLSIIFSCGLIISFD